MLTSGFIRVGLLPAQKWRGNLMDFSSRISGFFLSPVIGFLILVTAILVLTTCSSDDPVETPTPTGTTVGAGGGTVTDSGGASVTIPPGALTEDVVISVKTYQDPATGPFPIGPVPVFYGGAQFGPAGTEFLSPVTINFPTRAPLNPGDDYNLFVYDTVNLCWEIVKGSAIVAADGQSLVADISHFSVFNGGGLAGGGQARSDITLQLCDFGSAQAICYSYIAYFKQFLAEVGEKEVWDGQCKEVVGLKMDITCDVNGDYHFEPVRDGVFEGEMLDISDQEECSRDDGEYNYAALDAYSIIYYKCVQPVMTVAADPTEIELGGSSTVTAKLICGEKPFPEAELQFDRAGFGQLDRHSGTTDGAGQAQTTLTNNDQEGETTVTAYYSACSGQENHGTVTAEAVINTSGGWSGNLNVAFDHPIGGTPLNNFADNVVINFDLSIDEGGNITGSGTGSHAVTVTPGGECWTASVSAPSFAVLAAGTATDETLNFVVYPNPMMPVSFVITCQHGEDTVDYPYPMGEGLIEGSILTQDISISVARQDGATDSGSGSRSEGTDLPMNFAWDVTISEGN